MLSRPLQHLHNYSTYLTNFLVIERLEKLEALRRMSQTNLLKVARRGLYSTAALYIADCALAPNDVVSSFISRGATTPSGAEALY
jgi:hypothetical protein